MNVKDGLELGVWGCVYLGILRFNIMWFIVFKLIRYGIDDVYV